MLILENQSFQRAIAVKILGQLGCREVFEASGGSEAITLLERIGRVDVAICDVRMEGMDGVEFIHRAAESSLIGGVIVSSGLHSEVRRAITQLLTRLGVSFLGDVGKPLQLDSMRQALDRLRGSATLTLPAPNRWAPVSEADIRRGLSYKEFVAHYLPRCDLANGEIHGVDVVAQWRHPEKGILAGNQFMPVVERCGLLDDMLVVLLEQGLELQRTVMSEGQVLRLSFALELAQLGSRGLTRRIKSLMQFHRSVGQGIGFELAFDGAAEPTVMHLESLIRLRMLGCGLGLGAFGGHGGSFLRLSQLPFNEVKTSSQLMHELDNQPRNRAALRASLGLARSLGMNITVAGVENAEQHLMLMSMGCTLGQGRYFAPLLGQEELLKRLGSVRR
ncbi:EAL domain-containing protein [Pseudomonas sp. 148P]|uniref:EAL domain-containing protein n=1 Tax=Pseudomonas ulcerans TaxID=3115852 RepID=A0ABU7HNI2_9PSED|nr:MULTISPECIES: EAL domain-containing protein [unclassified Pseudomonas]MEE1923600.1 EAL domain-containing protein [Pseudomonas sp. 147P]MEE1933098.1 EAL domain-containing protein [Pseudomonas sp. 148P]